MVPNKYKTAGTLTLVAGIYNLVMGLVLGGFLFLYIGMLAVITFGLGCVGYVCMVFPLLQLITGVIEIVVGFKVQSGEMMPNAKSFSILGIVVAAMGMQIVPALLEIFSLMQMNDDEVVAWLEAGDNTINA